VVGVSDARAVEGDAVTPAAAGEPDASGAAEAAPGGREAPVAAVPTRAVPALSTATAVMLGALAVAFLAAASLAAGAVGLLALALLVAALTVVSRRLCRLAGATFAAAFLAAAATPATPAPLVGGAILAAPAILYHIWKFIAPGLYPSEKRLVAPFVFFATVFFFIGAAFCYLVVLPFGYQFLLEFTDISDPQIMMSEYFSTTTKLLFGFGLIFELPVFSMFLSALGVITHRTLLKYWRIAVVSAFLMAALFTPPDILTQSMMAGPLLLLYGLSIGVAWIFTRRRKRDDEQ